MDITFERQWKKATQPPKESGRYWCLTIEQTDTGKSIEQQNCAYNKDQNTWSDKGATTVVRWTELAPIPNNL